MTHVGVDRLALIYACTVCGLFVCTIVLACYKHFDLVRKNECPDSLQFEFLPSLSAVIGDYYPERSLFRFVMATTSGVRLAMAVAYRDLFHLSVPSWSMLTTTLFTVDVVRILAAGGWIYISSRESIDMHIGSFAAYLALSFVYGFGVMFLLSRLPRASRPRHYRMSMACKRLLMILSVAGLGLAGYYYAQHKLYCAPAAYSKYACWEWVVSFCNIAFDGSAFYDLTGSVIVITSARHVAAGTAVKARH